MQIKPNRLVFQEKPEHQSEQLPKIAMATQPLRELKEQVQENNSLAYQITLAMERFSGTFSREASSSFKGDDMNAFETRQNLVFNYAYEQLDAFLKRNTNPAWPFDLQKEWINAAVDWMMYSIHTDDPLKLFSPMTSKDIDECISQLENSDAAVPYKSGDKILKSPGTFKNWLYRTWPGQFMKIFGGKTLQFQRKLDTGNSSLASCRALAVDKFYMTVVKNKSSIRVDYEGDDLTTIDVARNAVIVYATEQLDAFLKRNTNPAYPFDLQEKWTNEVVDWLVVRFDDDMRLPSRIKNKHIDQFISELTDPDTFVIEKRDKIGKPPGTFEEWLLNNYSDQFERIFGKLPELPEI